MFDILNSYKEEGINMNDTKEKLNTLLNDYQYIFSRNLLVYLEYLIDLKVSAGTTAFISDDDRKKLLQLEVYREIAKFNIYFRALKLANISNESSSYVENGYLNLIRSINKQYYKIFEFDYHNPKNIGHVVLHEIVIDEEERKKEIRRLKNKIENLYDVHNPTSIYIRNFSFLRNQEIELLLKKVKELESRENITPLQEFETKFTEELCRLFLEDYQIEEKELKPIKSDNRLQRRLIKNKPGLIVEKRIHLF